MEAVDAFAEKHKLTAEGREELNRLVEAATEEEEEEQPTLALFAKVKARQRWGEPDKTMETDGLSLFLDLVFVGVCFLIGAMLHHGYLACVDGGTSYEAVSAGCYGSACHDASGTHESHGRVLESAHHEVECVGLHVSLGHVFIFYLCLYSFWVMDVMWDAKYEARGKLQLAIEVTILFCIINTASCIHNIQELQENGQTWWWFCFFSMAILSMWMLRYLMMAFTCEKPNERREAGDMVVTLLLQLACLGAAWGCASYPENKDAYLAMLALFVVFPFIWLLRASASFLWHKIKHDKSVAEATYRETRTPMNQKFFARRINEFMMLMIGETVLQLVIVPWPRHNPPADGVYDVDYFVNLTLEQRRFIKCMFSGLIIALMILHCNLESGPSPGKPLLIDKTDAHFVVFVLLNMFKGMAIMLVGHGIEFALLDTEAEASKSGGVDQYLHFGLACAGTFLLQMLLKCFHDGIWEFLGPIITFKSPLLSTLAICRFMACNAMWAIAWIEHDPWQLVYFQAGLTSFCAIATHIEKHIRYWRLGGNAEKVVVS